MSIRAYAASESKAEFKEFDYDPGTLGDDEVEIAVEYCGVCHSDLSMWQNDWGMSDYPFVGGHEVAGKVVEKGGAVSHLEIGQKVGLGWHARSCGTCDQCLGGNHNLCRSGVGTITGRHGGFAERVRAQSLWVTPLPDALSMEKVGPLFCGGITVFNPIVQNHVSPSSASVASVTWRCSSSTAGAARSPRSRRARIKRKRRGSSVRTHSSMPERMANWRRQRTPSISSS